MDIYLETPRTIIRELLQIDAPGMFEMDSDPEVHRYVGKTPVKTIEETKAVIDFVRKQYTDNGIGRWAIIDKNTQEFIGWTGFKLMREKINGHHDFYDFGYRLNRKFWNKGLATETGQAALKYGIKLLQPEMIYAMTDVDNVASRNVLTKLGFEYKYTFNYDGSPIWREDAEPTTWFEYKP